MKKSHIFTLLVFVVLIPLTLFLGTYFKELMGGRFFYVTSTLIIIEMMLPFFMAFEGRKPQARELVVLAVLSALAVAGRAAIPIPNFKAIFAIIMLAGIAFGPEAGFLVGAVSAFASNFFYGQGPFTPWQMMAFGAGGMLASFVFGPRGLPRKPLLLAIFGALITFLFVGPLLDTCSVFMNLTVFSWEGVLGFYLSGLPVNASQAGCTFLTMILFGRPLLEKLDRIKLKYGMMEDKNGL